MENLILYVGRPDADTRITSPAPFGGAPNEATLVNSRWLAYVGAAAIYAIVFDAIPRFVLKAQMGLMDAGTRNQIIFAFFAAPGLLHYWIDAHIWKIRSDPELRTSLQL